MANQWNKDLTIVVLPYRRKRADIKAIIYDGSEEMANALEAEFEGVYCDYDEAGVFTGLRGFTEWGYDNSTSECVKDLDYLIVHKLSLTLMDKQDFEALYEF